MNLIPNNDIIDGTEFIKFTQESTPFIERKYGLYFKKDDKREVKTLVGILNRIEDPLTIKQDAWNSFKIFNLNDRLIMQCELFDDDWESDKFENSAHEEHIRKYKVNDISELISYIMHHCLGIRKYENFSDINFDIKHWLVEQSLKPHEILKRRILQIINYCKYVQLKNINLNQDVKSYLTDYLQMILRQTLRNPDGFNYIIGLRISKYMTQDKFLEFNIALKLVTAMLKRGEKVTYDRIKRLQDEYDKFENNFVDYINYRINK